MDKMTGITMIVGVRTEYICTFETFDTWVNKASSWIGGFNKHEQIICLDKNDNACTIGEDFMHSRDNDFFPVRAFRLIRSSENK